MLATCAVAAVEKARENAGKGGLTPPACDLNTPPATPLYPKISLHNIHQGLMPVFVKS